MHVRRSSWAGAILVAAWAASGASPSGAARAIPAPAPERDSPVEAGVVKAQNAFAVELYRRLAEPDAGASRFLSPYSVFTALAMTAEGARGATADELGRVLHLDPALRRHGTDAAARPWDLAPVHAGLGALARSLEPADPAGAPAIRARIASLRAALAAADAAAKGAMASHDWDGAQRAQREAETAAAELNTLLPQVDRYELRVANALWGEARLPFAPAFVRALDAHYGTGGVRSVDFLHHAEEARRRINDWAAEATAQRIRDLLPAGSVDATTRLVLTDAVYFKGEWGEVFDAQATRDEQFRLAAGGSRPVPLMRGLLRRTRYAAFRADGSPFPTPREVPMDERDDAKGHDPGATGFQVVELPYKGGELVMDVLLPGAPDGLAGLERQLTAERLGSWLGRLEPRSVHTLLPRFRLELGGSLSGPLRALGLRRAFVDPARGNGAEFDGMTVEPGAGLFVGDVIHKAFVEVNERGTEAAAATAVVMRATAAMVRTRPFVPTFRADRPFLFLIRDARSGCILFMGRFARP